LSADRAGVADSLELTSTERLAERVAELEIKLLDAEDTIEAMNRSLFRQQQQIDFLLQELKSLRQQMPSSGPGEFRSLLEEVPPHY
jgi:SlyX protein